MEGEFPLPCGGCLEISEVEDGLSIFLGVAFPIVGLAFVAFSVWLAVRIFNRRERWARRTAVGLAASLICYLLTFGPAIWLEARGHLSHDVVKTAYWPVLWGFASAAAPIREIGIWYGSVGIPDDWSTTIVIYGPGGDRTNLTFSGRRTTPISLADAP